MRFTWFMIGYMTSFMMFSILLHQTAGAVLALVFTGIMLFTEGRREKSEEVEKENEDDKTEHPEDPPG